jgi:hypothetical protein
MNQWKTLRIIATSAWSHYTKRAYRLQLGKVGNNSKVLFTAYRISNYRSKSKIKMARTLRGKQCNVCSMFMCLLVLRVMWGNFAEMQATCSNSFEWRKQSQTEKWFKNFHPKVFYTSHDPFRFEGRHRQAKQKHVMYLTGRRNADFCRTCRNHG